MKLSKNARRTSGDATDLTAKVLAIMISSPKKPLTDYSSVDHPLPTPDNVGDTLVDV